jgi:hypothetical protein
MDVEEAVLYQGINPGIFLEGLRAMKRPVRIAGDLSKIKTKYKSDIIQLELIYLVTPNIFGVEETNLQV